MRHLIGSLRRFSKDPARLRFGMDTKDLQRETYYQEMKKLLTDSTDEIAVMDGVHYQIQHRKMLMLNRPKALNALNLNMVRTMTQHMLNWARDPSAMHMLIVKGAGEKAFCAGGDVLAVTNSAKSGEGSYHKDFFREEYRLNYLIGTYVCPVISIMDGITMGGGCGIAINGMYKVATERTMLAMPETALGLFPDVGGSYFLSRLKGNLGMFLALTGYRLKGADVYHAGLATNYVESSKLETLERTLLLDEVLLSDYPIFEAIDSFEPEKLPPFSLEPHLAMIEKCFDGHSVEDIIINLEKNGSDFAKKLVQELRKMSPTSLKVTFEQLRRGKTMEFEEIFTMEYRLTQRFMNDHDFHEGCRAILIDKDRNPKWNPNKLDEVTEEKVKAYFAPFENPIDELVIKHPPYVRHWSERFDDLLSARELEAVRKKSNI